MKRKKRFSWTFSFITRQGVRQFVLKDFYIYTAVALIAVFFLSTSLLTLGGIKKRYLYSEFKKQCELREGCISSLEKLREEIESLKAKVRSHSIFDDKLRHMVGLSNIERRLRVMGVGGPSALDTLEGKLSSSSYDIVSDLVKEINFTEKHVELEKTSYEEVYRKLESVIDLKRHTPSIWPASGYISSGFGYRRHPIRKIVAFHRGIDIANLPGTKIYATADGIVDFAGRQSGYGNYLSINHGYGFKSKYGHLKKILVEKGQSVKRGALIATMGSSGMSTGPHLQYEVRILGNPANPIHYIITDTLSY